VWYLFLCSMFFCMYSFDNSALFSMTPTRFDLEETSVITFIFLPGILFLLGPRSLSRYSLLWERAVFCFRVGSFSGRLQYRLDFDFRKTFFHRPFDDPRAFFTLGDYSTALFWMTPTRFDLKKTSVTTFTFLAVYFC